MVIFPWQLSSEHENYDSASDMIPELLKVKELTMSVLINSGTAGVLNLTEAKLMVPFFGGADDRKAAEVALAFGILSTIIYYKTERELEDEDMKLLEKLSHYSEKEPSVVYSVREFNEMEDNFVYALREEYENSHFSLICVGYTSAVPSVGDPSDLEVILGTIAGKLINDDFPAHIMVVKSGEDCNLLSL